MFPPPRIQEGTLDMYESDFFAKLQNFCAMFISQGRGCEGRLWEMIPTVHKLNLNEQDRLFFLTAPLTPTLMMFLLGQNVM